MQTTNKLVHRSSNWLYLQNKTIKKFAMRDYNYRQETWFNEQHNCFTASVHLSFDVTQLETIQPWGAKCCYYESGT